MDESWYEKAAKSGLLGSRAKTSAESKAADWYAGEKKDDVGRARKSLVERLGNMFQPGAHAKEKDE